MLSTKTVVKAVLTTILITSVLSLLIAVALGFLHLKPIFTTTTNSTVDGELTNDGATFYKFVGLFNNFVGVVFGLPSDVVSNTTADILGLSNTLENITSSD